MKQAILPYALVFCLFPIVAAPAQARPPAFPVAGKFYLEVDDVAEIFLAFRNKADWVWGESKKGNAYLAALVAKTMFEEFTP